MTFRKVFLVVLLLFALVAVPAAAASGPAVRGGEESFLARGLCELRAFLQVLLPYLGEGPRSHQVPRSAPTKASSNTPDNTGTMDPDG